MVLHFIMYLICFIAIFVYNVVDTGYVPFILGIVFVLMSIVSLVVVCILRAGINVEFLEEQIASFRKDKAVIRFVVTNKSPIPLNTCCVKVIVKKNGRKGYKKVKGHAFRKSLRIMCRPGESRIGEVKIKCPHCENLRVCIKRIYVLDYFNFFFLGKKNRQTCDIIVVPKLPDIEVMRNMWGEIEEDDDKMYSTVKAGDDPTEIFGMREYEGGDKIRSIHWKLSSKVGELMVKEYGLPLTENDTVVLDLFGNSKKRKKRQLKVYDEMFDLLHGLIHTLTSRGFGFNMCYYNNGFVCTRVETQNDIFSLFADLYKIVPYSEKVSAAQLYYGEKRLVKSRVFYVTPYYNKTVTKNMEIMALESPVYYLIPGQVKNSRMPVKYK
ncbi:MAG: DUF58 domain-containing protein [Butyrivibrio sp.]